MDRNRGLGTHWSARSRRVEAASRRCSYRSAGELAEAEGVTRSFVNRMLRLTLLAPHIQEAILDGRQPKGMQLVELTKGTPSSWKEQEKLAHFG